MYYIHSVDKAVDGNNVKDLVIQQLIRDGLLKGDYRNLCSRYVVVLKGKGWFGRLWDRLFVDEKHENQEMYFKILINPEPFKEEKENE